jgi:hypothetical protein
MKMTIRGEVVDGREADGGWEAYCGWEQVVDGRQAMDERQDVDEAGLSNNIKHNFQTVL